MTGRELQKNNFARLAGHLGTRMGRVVTLALLIVGGTVCFAAWLQTELNPRLHPHSTVVGRVSGPTATAATGASRSATVTQASEGVGANAQRPRATHIQSAPDEKLASAGVPQYADFDKIPAVRQPVKSGPGVAQISASRVRPRPPVPVVTTRKESQEPPFMSTFAHH